VSLFDHPDFDEHEHISFLHDAASGLRGIVAIHSTGPFGIAGGGCRMWPYPSDADALRDALRLSRAMSYKLALCDLPSGGAKCVVMGDPRKDKSESLLLALGRAVDRLGGHYVIAEDVGTTPDDMRVIARSTKYVVGQQTDTGPVTAHGAFVGLKTAVAREFGPERSLEGLRVAVQGAGSVGRRLCESLAAAGASLVVADVNEDAARRIADRCHARIVDTTKIYDEEVDVFAPCALGSILNDDTIDRLRCRVVAGAANNQLAVERHADALAARGILYAPDFVMNAGGVLGASQEGLQLGEDDAPASYDETAAFREADRIAAILAEVFERADRESVSPHIAAVRMAKEKIKARAAH
jgi:leucine dehydrogenase